jgi:nanoRNase/pAp phosphatase (c-di-AMP/oligoRNAs hydrolase)
MTTSIPTGTGILPDFLSLHGSILLLQDIDFPSWLQDLLNNLPFPSGASAGTVINVILGVLALVILLGGIYKLIHRIRNSPGKRFHRVLEEHDEVTVLMHPNPDPDAMACAMAVEALGETVDSTVHIQYTGQIRHQENRAFRTVLNCDCTQIETASDLATRDAVILVDHNTARGFTEAEKIEPIAVVDHHPGNGTGTEFTDIRTDYGAAATIFSEYFTEIGGVLETPDLTTEDRENAEVLIQSHIATGLIYGIQSDTKHLTRGCSPAEFTESSSLFPGIDEDLLDRIANPELSHDVLKVKARAINDIMIEGSFGVCNVGDIDNVDALSQAADELLRLEGVTVVVVYGLHNGTIHLSGRSRDDRVHIGECLQHTVSDLEMGNAGGHARMGGGQIPVNHADGIGTANGMDYNEFTQALFDSLNGDH